MTKSVRVQCAHRNRLFRQCLKSVLETQNFSVQEVDHERWDYCRAIEEWRPDVLLLDLGLPERRAVDLTRYVRKFLQGTKVILLVPSPQPNRYEKQLMLECVGAGVHGYILDESPLEELKKAIEQALQGAVLPQIVESLFAELASLALESSWPRNADISKLTRRELEVLKWIAEGLSNKQVAKRLSVSLYTVKNHVHNILRKLEVDDRFAAVQHAVENEWLPSNSFSAARV